MNRFTFCILSGLIVYASVLHDSLAQRPGVSRPRQTPTPEATQTPSAEPTPEPSPTPAAKLAATPAITPTPVAQGDSDPEPTEEKKERKPRVPLFKRIFGGGKDRETPTPTPEPEITPGPPAPTKPRATPQAAVEPAAVNPATTPIEASVTPPETTPVPTPEVKPTPEAKPTPEVKPEATPEAADPTKETTGLQMEDATDFVTEDVTDPLPPAPLVDTGDIVAKLRELRKDAREDTEVISALEKVQSASTEPEYFEARKSYLQVLYNKVRNLDPSITPLADATETASLKRLENRRDVMREVFESGQHPPASPE